MSKSKILVTGAAGFIGSNLVEKLLLRKYDVIGVDNFNDYYDPKIKEENIISVLKKHNFKLYREDILNLNKLERIFRNEKIDVIVHLAARAGVRPSINKPKLYAKVNVLGTVNLLKLSVDYKVKRFIFGSSSSVYGNSKQLPFSESDPCDQIISPYGASKRSAEFFVESFHKSFDLNCTILRFFTVYGPRSRPDMAPAIFTKKIFNGETIQQYGDGLSSRDYTFVDDITNGIVLSLEKESGFEVINLGNNHPIVISDFIKMIEYVTGKKTKIIKLSKCAGDMENTWADIKKANRLLGWKPETDLKEGLKRYILWLRAN